MIWNEIKGLQRLHEELLFVQEMIFGCEDHWFS